MRSLLAEAIFFLRGQPNHPIYRREMAGWSYLRFWRGLRRGCLPLMALIILGMAACCGLLVLPSILDLSSPSSSNSSLETALLALPAILLFGVYAGGETIKLLTGLIATALTSTTISAEIESDTFALLRLTPVQPRQIVLAKFGAAFNQIRLPIVTVMVTRLVSVVGGVALIIFYTTLAASIAPTQAAGSPATTPISPIPIGQIVPVLVSSALVGVSILVAALVWLIGFIFVNPLLDMLLFAAVGLFASSLTRTRSGGLFAAGGMRVGLWAVSYALSQVVSSAISLLAFPLMLMPATSAWLDQMANTQPGLLVLGFAVVSILSALVIGAGEFGLTLLLLSASGRRAERLPFIAA